MSTKRKAVKREKLELHQTLYSYIPKLFREPTVQKRFKGLKHVPHIVSMTRTQAITCTFSVHHYSTVLMHVDKLTQVETNR